MSLHEKLGRMRSINEISARTKDLLGSDAQEYARLTDQYTQLRVKAAGLIELRISLEKTRKRAKERMEFLRQAKNVEKDREASLQHLVDDIDLTLNVHKKELNQLGISTREGLLTHPDLARTGEVRMVNAAAADLSYAKSRRELESEMLHTEIKNLRDIKAGIRKQIPNIGPINSRNVDAVLKKIHDITDELGRQDSAAQMELINIGWDNGR